MKRAWCLLATALGLMSPAISASADPTAPGGAVNPYTQTDADGVPLIVTNPNLVPTTPGQQAEVRADREKAAVNKDWLIRNYEEQLQKRATANPQGFQSSNLYYQLSMNHDLARLAGLPDLDRVSPAISPASTLGRSPNSLGASPSRKAGSGTFTPYTWKPLINISSPNGLYSFYSSEPGSNATTLNPSGPASPDRSGSNSSDESDEMETPGMIAAKSDPSSQIDTPDLSLDVLPGETMAQARAERAANNSISLPEPMTADQLHQSVAEATTVSNALSVRKAETNVVAQPAKPLRPEDDPSAPMPVSEQPIITPVHAPIASPFDILNR